MGKRRKGSVRLHAVVLTGENQWSPFLVAQPPGLRGPLFPRRRVSGRGSVLLLPSDEHGLVGLPEDRGLRLGVDTDDARATQDRRQDLEDMLPDGPGRDAQVFPRRFHAARRREAAC